jgi:hypothetical protein
MTIRRCTDKNNKFKKPLFDLDVKVQGHRKVIMVHDTPPCGHAPIPNIIDLSQKKQLFHLQVKGQGPTKVIMVCNTPPYGHAPTYQISLTSRKKQLFDLEVKGQGPNKGPSNEGRYICFSLIFFFCFFSAKLVRTLTFDLKVK